MKPFIVTAVLAAVAAGIGLVLGRLAASLIPDDLFDVDITPEEI